MTSCPGDAPPQASSQCSPEQAVDEFLKRLPVPCRLLVAFSGGGDSTGLLAALSSARRGRSDLSLHAATVDHGLRSGSADEARAASLTSHALGVPHALLPWTGEKPVTGIQAAAREARYRLLAAEAGRVGADLIVTGHNLDDQAETTFMRRQRNPVLSGGMDEAVLIERRVWVARPFLRVGREAIRQYLRQRGLNWSEDPSNDNTAFERVRVRKSGAARFDSQFIDRGPNPHLAAAAFVRDHVGVRDGRIATVDLQQCDPRHEPHWIVIATLAAILGGRVHGPDAATAHSLVDRLAGRADFRTTANRVLFDRRGSMLHLCREDRGLPKITIAPGVSALWDGRYEIVNDGPEALTVGAGRVLGTARPLLPMVAADVLPGDVVRRAVASTPRIIEGETAVLRVRTVLAPFEKFLPARKLALANSLATAFELEQFPSLPLSNGAF